MREEPCHPAVSAIEWMNPQESMMGGSHSNNLPQPGQSIRSIGFDKAGQKPLDFFGRWRNMLADLNPALLKFSRNDLNSPACIRIFDPKQFLGQTAAELAMYPANKLNGDDRQIHIAEVNHARARPCSK